MAWLMLCMLGAAAAQAQAQAPLRLACLENIPDQQVGAEILQAVYQRLGLAVEFIDMAASGELERLREEITARMIRQAVQ